MSLRSLSALVLAVLLGTAVSVRWYLQADEEPAVAGDMVSPAAVLEHVPLPMWAEPAPRPASTTPSPGLDGVARRGQFLSVPSLSEREDPRPAGGSGAAAAGAFLLPVDSL